MITFIAFVLTILGCINWLLIGLLQYDFIAGLFGFQASIFSRIIYILFGVGAIYLTLRVIINKGSFKVFERKKKKEEKTTKSPAYANVEASKEQVPSKNEQEQDNLFDERNRIDEDFYERKNDEGLFDEHFKNQ